MVTREQWRQLFAEMRRRYRPDKFRIVFFAISPPAQNDPRCPRYFYNDVYCPRRGLRWELSGILAKLSGSQDSPLRSLKRLSEVESEFGRKPRDFLIAFRKDCLYVIDLYPWPAPNSRIPSKFLRRYGLSKPVVDEIRYCKPRSAVVLWKDIPKKALSDLRDILGFEPEVTYFPYPRGSQRSIVRRHVMVSIRHALERGSGALQKSRLD